nr:hypothetical protein [Tanacetum cinerariifolium]
MVFWNSMLPRTETDWSLCMRKAKQCMHIVLDAINRLGGTKTDLFSFSPSDPYSLDVLAVTVTASEPVLFGGQTFVASSAPASLRFRGSTESTFISRWSTFISGAITIFLTTKSFSLAHGCCSALIFG